MKKWIYAAALASLLLGVYCGEPQQVLQKAATICLECIGIG
jgi:hypothetical protein